MSPSLIQPSLRSLTSELSRKDTSDVSRLLNSDVSNSLVLNSDSSAEKNEKELKELLEDVR
jgi:hypothetical protein